MSAAFLDDLARAGDGDAAALARARAAIPSLVGVNGKLIAMALARAGTDEDRAAIDAHERDGEWARHVPLDTVELEPIVSRPPDCSRVLAEELALAPWGELRVGALGGDDAARAARLLLDELHILAASAAHAARVVPTLRAAMRAHALHAMQAAALLRVAHVAPRVGGRAVLEIGAAEGALVDALAAQGFDARGVDVLEGAHPRVTVGDFLKDNLGPPRDIVVATALLEWGSGLDPAVLEDPATALSRLRLLVRVGGALVLENVRLPLPFGPSEATALGFTVVDHRVPSPTLALGGRGITLVRTG